MKWYEEAVFYHIYPLGLCGAPEKNKYEKPVHRLNEILPWIAHIQKLGCTALYIGPLCESYGHGYETTDYYRPDSRLGTAQDLKNFVKECHDRDIRVIFDGVFNHTGRDFFAFKDLKNNRENSRYKDWYCNVNFHGNNEFNDGFSYDSWGGYNIMAKLNQRNPEVRDYICNVIRFWVSEFDIDGIRLDAADVLDFDFMKQLRRTANEVKADFWLMGEVIHGDYSRWANDETLHSVTNYALHKALYSAHNDHNYFEIAHTIRRQFEICPESLKLYNFTDNHDVERIMSKLNNKAHYVPVQILLYTLPGIPSVYYGSEFGIEGKKTYGTDAPLRPHLDLYEYRDAFENNPCTKLTAALGRIHKEVKELSYGSYRELQLSTEQYAFAREEVIITVNNADHAAESDLPARDGIYTGALCGKRVKAENSRLHVSIPADSGEIWIPEGRSFKPVEIRIENTANRKAAEAQVPSIPKEQRQGKSYEEMSIAELQAEILEKMAERGPVSDRMKQDVANNIWHDSLVNWVKSFR